jgi:hypothetical protein
MSAHSPYWGAISISGLALTYHSLQWAVAALRRDRFALVRCHPWRWVRRMYQRLAIYHFAWKVCHQKVFVRWQCCFRYVNTLLTENVMLFMVYMPLECLYM